MGRYVGGIAGSISSDLPETSKCEIAGDRGRSREIVRRGRPTKGRDTPHTHTKETRGGDGRTGRGTVTVRGAGQLDYVVPDAAGERENG